MPFIGNKPSAVPLTSADIADSIITSAKIVDATIANADIANSTINLTTKVTGTLPVANGGTGLAALGTSLQELRVNSGATALEYYTPTVASSDFVLLASTDASSSASVSFDGYFSSTYKNYCFIYSQVKPASSASLTLRVRQSNSDLTSNYQWVENVAYLNSDTTVYNSASGAWSTSSIRLGDDTSSTSIDGTKNGTFYIYNPLSSGPYKLILGNCTYFNSAGNRLYVGSTSGYNATNGNALSGITFLASTGNISSGNFKLYGIK